MLAFPLTNAFAVPNARAWLFGLVAVAFVFKLLDGYRLRKIPPIIYGYLFLVIWLYIGLFYTRSLSYGLEKVTLVTSYYIVLTFILFHLTQTLKEFELFAFGMFLGALGTLIVVIFQFGNPLSLLGGVSRFYRLSLGEHGNPIEFARYLSFAVIFMFWFVLRPGRALHWIWILPLILLSVFYMMLTGSKGPLAGLAMGLVFAFMLYSRRSVIVLPLLIIMFGALIFGLTSLLPGDFISERFTKNVSNLSLRLPVYMQTYQALLDSNSLELLIGRGTGSFSYFFSSQDTRIYPHNIFLEVGFENGLVGVVLLSIVVFSPIINAVGARRQFKGQLGVTAWAFSAAYIAALLNAQWTGDLSANFFVPIFGTILVSYIRVRGSTSSRPTQKTSKPLLTQSVDSPTTAI